MLTFLADSCRSCFQARPAGILCALANCPAGLFYTQMYVGANHGHDCHDPCHIGCYRSNVSTRQGGVCDGR